MTFETAGHMVRIARLDLTLLWRNRTSMLTVLGMPVLFGGLLMLGREGQSKTAGLTSALYSGTGYLAFFLIFAVFVNLVGVFTARREDLTLKRLRSGPVSDRAILGGSVLSAAAIFAVMAAIVMVMLATVLEAGGPADPLLLAVSLSLGLVVCALLAFVTAGITPSAELSQWTGAPLVFLSIVGSGVMFPTDGLPDGLERAAALLPLTPVVDLARTAYLGRDFTHGGDHAEIGILDGWAAGGPAFLVLLGWVAVGAWLARRWFRWEPRHG